MICVSLSSFLLLFSVAFVGLSLLKSCSCTVTHGLVGSDIEDTAFANTRRTNDGDGVQGDGGNEKKKEAHKKTCSLSVSLRIGCVSVLRNGNALKTEFRV